MKQITQEDINRAAVVTLCGSSHIKLMRGFVEFVSGHMKDERSRLQAIVNYPMLSGIRDKIFEDYLERAGILVDPPLPVLKKPPFSSKFYPLNLLQGHSDGGERFAAELVASLIRDTSAGMLYRSLTGKSFKPAVEAYVSGLLAKASQYALTRASRSSVLDLGYADGTPPWRYRVFFALSGDWTLPLGKPEQYQTHGDPFSTGTSEEEYSELAWKGNILDLFTHRRGFGLSFDGCDFNTTVLVPWALKLSTIAKLRGYR